MISGKHFVEAGKFIFATGDVLYHDIYPSPCMYHDVLPSTQFFGFDWMVKCIYF